MEMHESTAALEHSRKLIEDLGRVPLEGAGRPVDVEYALLPRARES